MDERGPQMPQSKVMGRAAELGLSKVGDVREHLLALDSHCQGGALADEISVVELFGGPGALSKAFQVKCWGDQRGTILSTTTRRPESFRKGIDLTVSVQ